jgi:hypothetical protein
MSNDDLVARVKALHAEVCSGPFDGSDPGCNLTVSGAALARLLADAAPAIDEERLARALHEVYCHRNAPMHSAPDHSAKAIVAALPRGHP